MSATNRALDHAVRECWRANDRALSAAGCLELALDEVQKLLKEGEDPTLCSVAKEIPSAVVVAEDLAKRAESVRAKLDSVLGS